MVPSIRQIGLALEGLFIMEQWNNYGPDYDRTLMAWYQNVNDHWIELKKNYTERFYRMWKYYLMASAGSFRSRKNQLWQIILTKKGLNGTT
jgi:cyclopropane-fatty-acyl-phospholipid synthase